MVKIQSIFIGKEAQGMNTVTAKRHITSPHPCRNFKILTQTDSHVFRKLKSATAEQREMYIVYT